MNKRYMKYDVVTETQNGKNEPLQFKVGEAVQHPNGEFRITFFAMPFEAEVSLVPCNEKKIEIGDSDIARFIHEVNNAKNKNMSYVGVSFFVSRWKASGFSTDVNYRRRVLDLAIERKYVELYTHKRDDGKEDQAIKVLVDPDDLCEDVAA